MNERKKKLHNGQNESAVENTCGIWRQMSNEFFRIATNLWRITYLNFDFHENDFLSKELYTYRIIFTYSLSLSVGDI